MNCRFTALNFIPKDSQSLTLDVCFLQNRDILAIPEVREV